MDQEKIWEYFQNDGVESFSQSSGRLEYIVRHLSPGSRVLNIGVGSGQLERLAQSKGVDIWSLDPSERAINRLRRSMSLGEKAQVGFSQRMPFPSNHFDDVVMSEVLEHLDDGILESTLSEVQRVLKPAGRLIGTVPAREVLANEHTICPRCGHGFHRWGHVRSFDIDTLRTTLSAKFSVDKAVEVFFVDWASVGFRKKVQGIIKKILSWRRIGTYGIYRNIFFIAIATRRTPKC